jgi:hypothetical protein
LHSMSITGCDRRGKRSFRIGGFGWPIQAPLLGLSGGSSLAAPAPSTHK